MTQPVTGAHADVGTGHEARDRSAIRGPSRVQDRSASRERIRTFVREKEAAGERAVLGLATGSTPIGVYRELIRMHRTEGLSFTHVVTFNLDEYYPMRGEMSICANRFSHMKRW